MIKIIRRFFLILPALLIETAILGLLFSWLKPYAIWINAGLRLIGMLTLLYIVSNRQEGTYKILWLILLFTLPVPAALMYLLWGNGKTAVIQNQKIIASGDKISLPAEAKAEYPDSRYGDTLCYLNRLTGSELRKCDNTEYYPLGEDMFRAMKEELSGAERYIFIESFIVKDGVMWSGLLDILARKVKSGVDVRLIYDDLGSVSTFSKEEVIKLRKCGIKFLPFNRLVFLKGTINNRSHRKMMIIDGRTVFSGGINIADEYINERVRFGHWKDIGFKLQGPAALEYLKMFVSFWNAFSGNKIPASVFEGIKDCGGGDGSALSYCDMPGGENAVSNDLYIDLLGSARKRAWFYTPYLILGDALTEAFIRAAKRGVDVRIVLPGIPDKKLVFRMSRSSYRHLLDAGVRIYEYSPGFVHAKASIFDDEICTIGTVNLDYRSLFLHYENNSIFWGGSILGKLEADFSETLEKCSEVLESSMSSFFLSVLFDELLRIIAPLI